MRSPAEARLLALARGPDLLDHVDYRLAETPEEKEEIYNLRYRAYLREGAVEASPDQRVTDQLRRSAEFVDFRRLSRRRTLQFGPDQRSDFGMARCPIAEVFGDILYPRLDRGEVIIDPARFVADPDRARRSPELPYLTLRLAYMACEYFNADTGARDRSSRTSGVLSPRVPP